ncbi:MAG TPA: 50S ribosome-binding GTPase, partial [Miltoncostaeales bacterium]|nr:50S ribosome-binding GTPase [Miltoncostaeales bacterium]
MSAIDPIRDRIATLSQVNELGEGLVSEQTLERSRALVDRSSVRLEHGTSHTVVALAGATGSGKSSLFNAIAGAQIARSGVRRPTTSTAEAVTFGGESADGLLDWLQVPSRHIHPDPAMEGLVLLDLPDHDSFAESHRAEVDRLVEVVDIFCWVVDPQKYADAALHDGYLKRFGGHGTVTLVVFNQMDRIPEDQRPSEIRDNERLVRILERLRDAGN